MTTPKKKPATAKKSVRKQKGTIADGPVECCYREKRSVRITEADNGFTVSAYGPKGEEILIAKSPAEAMRHTKTLLGSGKK
jgi:hypothetical protein